VDASFRDAVKENVTIVDGVKRVEAEAEAEKDVACEKESAFVVDGVVVGLSIPGEDDASNDDVGEPVDDTIVVSEELTELSRVSLPEGELVEIAEWDIGSGDREEAIETVPLPEAESDFLSEADWEEVVVDVDDAISEIVSDTVVDAVDDTVCEDDAVRLADDETPPESVLLGDASGEPVSGVVSDDVADDERVNGDVGEKPEEPEAINEPVWSRDSLATFDKVGVPVYGWLTLPADVRVTEALDVNDVSTDAVKVAVRDIMIEGVPKVGVAYSVEKDVDEAPTDVVDEDDAIPEELDDSRADNDKQADTDASFENEAGGVMVVIEVSEDVPRTLELDAALNDSKTVSVTATEEDTQWLGDFVETAEALAVPLDDAHRVGSSTDAVLGALPLDPCVTEACKLVLGVSETAGEGEDGGEEDFRPETLPTIVTEPVGELDPSDDCDPDADVMTDKEDAADVDAVSDAVEVAEFSIEELCRAVGVSLSDASGE
jgi:hypothetical protein